jgi:hypothetical protein
MTGMKPEFFIFITVPECGALHFFPLFIKFFLSYYCDVSYEINRLNLIAPLFYAREEGPGTDPFCYTEGSGGRLFCFGLKFPLAFECEGENFLGDLTAGGTALGAAEAQALLEHKKLILPPGNYLFAQERRILSREEIIAMAIEIQQEGLWQRLTPGGRLFLRYLYEDGRSVTQVFRPFEES